MKKMGLICAAALIGLTLTACGSSSSQKSTKSSSSSSTKAIKKHKTAKQNKQEKKKQSSISSASSSSSQAQSTSKVSKPQRNQLSKKFKLTLPNHKAKLIVNVVTIQTVLHYYLVKTMPLVRIQMVYLMPGYKVR